MNGSKQSLMFIIYGCSKLLLHSHSVCLIVSEINLLLMCMWLCLFM